MNSPNLQSFVMAAREFCEFARASSPVGDSDLYTVRGILLRVLFHVPAMLAAPQSAEDYEGNRPDDEDYRRAAQRFWKFPFNYYRCVFDPHEISNPDAPAGMGMLSDDLADIYRDLAQGLDCFDNGFAGDACFYWALQYRTHWGRHAADALSAIEHFLLGN